jgi:dimeric dUTPase (all-alpha-NTP-PPase superfamily)
MTLANIDEITETLRETPWKPWKKHQVFNKNNYKKELADELHFFINRCLAVNMGSKELYKLYKDKNIINKKRKSEGY